MRHGNCRPQAQPHRSHRKAMFANMAAVADQARADRDHPAEGQGTASDRREAGHARQARRPARPPPGASPRSATRRVVKLFDVIGSALRRPQRRLHPHPEGRLPPRRQRRRWRSSSSSTATRRPRAPPTRPASRLKAETAEAA